MKASVIVPTHNRPEKLAQTLACLSNQALGTDDYEIIVVDDGSLPPVILPSNLSGPSCVCIRLEGRERSTARNRGAAVARGELLVFVDDDMFVGREFLTAHVRAHLEWPGVLAVGAVYLTDAALATAFGCFRQKLEDRGLPVERGYTSMPNFCTAQNMSISRSRFRELNGFDEAIVSGEDQDFALRHTALGGKIVFLPEAEAIHNDSALGIGSYCRRAEWGAEHMVAFCKRYPDLHDNIERHRVNGFVNLLREPLSRSVRKLVKQWVLVRPIQAGLFSLATMLERTAPGSYALDRVYRVLLGSHILRGYRRGLMRYAGISKVNQTAHEKAEVVGAAVGGEHEVVSAEVSLPRFSRQR